MPKKIGVKGTDSYGSNPYGQQTNVYGGAASNGSTGAQAPASQTNAASQKQSGGSTPANAFGDFSNAWGQALRPPTVPQPAQSRYYASLMSGGGAPSYSASSNAEAPAPEASAPQPWSPTPMTSWSNQANAGDPMWGQQSSEDNWGGGAGGGQPLPPSGPYIPPTPPAKAYPPPTPPIAGSPAIPPNPPAQGAPAPPGSVPPLQSPPPGGWHMPPLVDPTKPPPQQPSPPFDPNAPVTQMPWNADAGGASQVPTSAGIGGKSFSASSDATFTGESDRSRPSETPTDPLYQKLYDYASHPGYEYLKDQPDLLRGYYAYVDQLRTALQAGGLNGSQADRVDFVDYLKHQGQNSPDAGRNGYDTYMDIPETPNLGQTQSGGSGGYKQTTVGDPTNGVDPAIQGLVNSYINSDPRYGWLAQSPVAVQEYQQWANQTGNTDVDLVDWLKHQDAYSGKDNPQAGRNGYDTFLYKKDPTTGQVVARTGTAPLPDQNAIPGTTVTPSGGSGGYTLSGYIPPAQPPASVAAESQTPSTATTATGQPPQPGLGAPASTGQPSGTAAAIGGGTGAGTGAPAGTTGGVTPPYQGPGNDEWKSTAQRRAEAAAAAGQSANSPDSLMANLQKTLAPGFQYEQDQLTRAARASAASNGGYADDSGGMGANLLNAQQGLAADQGKRLSDYAATAEQKSLDRALQYYMTNTQAGTSRYEIDTNKAIAEMNADVQRLGITTNKDIEQGKLDLSRYGIDKNDLLDRYKAELALTGQKYSADKAFDAAAMQKAASTAIAAANERSAKYVADLQRQTELGQLAQNDTNSKRSYDLGVLGINSNVYGIDQNNLLKYYQMLMQYSTPGQLGQLPFPLPGQVMNP